MSAENARKSGIALVGDLPWGSHFCHFHETKQDLLDVVVPYFRAGLQSGEFCVWVTSGFVTPAEAWQALERGVPDLAACRARGQMEVFPHTGWYLLGGKFDLQRTLRMWRRKHDDAVDRGFAGMRVSGSPYWIDNKKDWDDFTAYEGEISKAIAGARILVLCTYVLSKCGVGEVLDVVKNHDFALSMSRGQWQLLKPHGPGAA